MIKKTVIGVCAFVFVAALSFPAFADQSIGYQTYFNEGVKAFKDHDDQKALRCFKIAQIYDPNNEDLNNYLYVLAQRGVVIEVRFSKPPEKSIGYRYYLSGGIEAFQERDFKKAIRYFNIALIFNPDSKEADRYLQILSQPNPYSTSIRAPSLVVAPQPVAVVSQSVATVPQPAAVVSQPAAVVMPEVTPYSPPELKQSTTAAAQPQPPSQPQQPQPEAVVPQAIVQPQPYSPSVQPQPVQSLPAVVAPVQSSLYVPAENAKKPVLTLMLFQITNNGQTKPRLQIELHSSVIIEGKNIRNFLVVNEGFIGVKTLDTDRLEIDAVAIGTTFLHIWDDYGRHTLYIEVVFPRSVYSGASQVMNGVQHSQPFIITYSNDWNTYYSGKNIPALKRQSYELDQYLSVKGETPYGMFDASGAYNNFDSISELDDYTIGLSQIPLEGTSNFNLRGFDALRYLSPLTMPQTRLRGAFADVDLLDDNLGLSVGHGQEEEQEFQGFTAIGQPQFYNAYIDFVKLTLFPKSNTDQYSFNYATAYGPDHPSYLSDHVYSVQGQHSFNDFLSLNAEEGSDSSHESSLASLKWQDGDFRSGLNFRNVDKDYATISTLPANQGETGVAWTTDTDAKNFTESTFIEAYQDHLDSNPDDPSAFNYDASGHLRADIFPNVWSDSDFNFMDTQGEESPNRSVGLNERVSRSFGIWNSLKGSVFAGPGYQNSQSTGSDIFNYDREDVIAGIQLPLTHQVSTYANYEYDWLDQPHSGGYSNPSIINAGFDYQKQVTPKLSFTAQIDYHDELGVNAGSNSFLSGEQSIIITSGFNYNPTPDVNIFADGDASNVLSHIGNPSYDDFEVHVGMRITFGGATYWDPLGTVSGVIFKDKNGNGKYVQGDEGIADIKVKVGDKIAVTDKLGRYSIQIRAKGVDVVPVLDTIPGGLIFSTPQTLNIQVIQGRTSRADFGLISQTGIYGLVFVDKNKTGVPNEGDKFVDKVKVTLDGKITQKSDSHGAFYFRQVSPGEHTISIDLNSLALDMVPLVKLENKFDVTEGTNYMFNIPVQIKQTVEEQD